MAKLFPVFRQMDQMDCGPTCLLMIASFYGKTLSLAEIRNRSHLTKDGVSLLSLSDVAESIGFQTLSLRITLESLRKQAKLPCIVHLDKNHFSVLYEITNSKVKIADPAIGSIEYDISDFLKRWSTENKADKSGIVLLIETTPRFHKTNSRKLKVPMGDGALKHLFQYLFQYKTQVLKLFICLFLGSGIQLLFPILTQAIVDQGINGKSIPLLYLVLVGQLALTVGRTTLDFTKKWILLHLSAKINISIISEFLTKLMQLPISFFGKTMLGDITRRIEDHSRIERFISSTSLSFGFSMINLVVYSVVLTIYNWKIYLIFFLSSICYLIFIQLFMAKRKELETQRFEESATNASNTIEIVQGIVEIKLNNCEKQKRWSWERSQMRLFDLRTNMARLQQYQEGGGQLINEFRNMIITFIAAQAVIDGSMTLGMMLALQYILGQLISPIAEMLNFIREYQETKMSLRRTTEIHTLENEDQENVPACTVICNQWHRITLDHVSFSYDPTSTKNALNNICLILPRGKVTALVGSSGSGKSTILKLLLKFYKAHHGIINIGTHNLDEIGCKQWRSKCGVVMQDGFIFSGSIANNICLSSTEIDLQQLNEAIRVANLQSFLDELPNGYNTRLGSGGIGVSHGQRQRILIARAIYKDPELLLLDEATSALDTENESIIMNNLLELGGHKTIILVAHRLSTVRSADQIIVLNKGQIVEMGRHVELISNQGFYFKLVKNQLETHYVFPDAD